MKTPSSAGQFRVELLRTEHDRKGFTCGIEALDTYLQKQARQERDRGASVTYVLVLVDNPTEIAGFYTLSSTGVPLQDMPPDVIKKLPRYPTIPATLIGRFAISQAHQGRRLGEYLLVDALSRSLEVSRKVGSVAVIVDAKNEGGAAFYERYGFRRFADQPLRLFIALETIAML